MMARTAVLTAVTLLVAPTVGLAPRPSRRGVLRLAPAVLGLAPFGATANIGGSSGNAFNLRLADPTGETVAVPAATREALAAAATAFGAVGAAFAEDDGGGSADVQAYFRRDLGALEAAVGAATAAAPADKAYRKAGRSFLAATAATREAYDTAEFEKAAERYDGALDLLVAFCARAGVVSDRPAAAAARRTAEPVTRRTYLPGPFQLL